ncbi:MAG: sigma-70 family RNA polymerase sigma factor [Chthoniobacter sp.]|uniref:sigma-70 family RNA polymerase sigma factor n=1 Tax=Chthoniobacter sp. TaxID=2510640 RepID=UPI0032A25AE3
MNPESDAAAGLDRNKQLMRLMTQHQRRIFGYIYTLVPDRHDAEDILQETSVVVCEKFEQFKPGTDFVAWACQIAYWEVRRARQKYARAKVVFDQEVVDAVAQTAAEMIPEVSARHEALGQCLQKLHARDRELVLTRYEPGSGVELAAQRSGRSLEAAYKALGRIRKLLHDCVTNQLSLEGAV